MAFDPDLDTNQTESLLRKIFGDGASHTRYRVPGSLEPELKNILPDNDLLTFKLFFDRLQNTKTVHILPGFHAPEKFLLSLREDTVDANGEPTQTILNNNLMRRRRADFNPLNRKAPFSQFDESLKDLLGAAKVTDAGLRLRREWEAHAYGKGHQFTQNDLPRVLSDGYNAFQKIGDLPDVLKTLDSGQLRVSSALMTSRASYHLLHHMPEYHAVMAYEVCNDCCIITTPHCDVMVARRTEMEMEIKDIYLTAPSANTETIETLIVESMHRMNDVIYGTGCNLTASEESKMEQSDQAVNSYYRQNGLSAIGGEAITDGVRHALLQNVTAQNFLMRPNQIRQMADSLPRARQLLPVGNGASSKIRSRWLGQDVSGPALIPA